MQQNLFLQIHQSLLHYSIEQLSTFTALGNQHGDISSFKFSFHETLIVLLGKI